MSDNFTKYIQFSRNLAAKNDVRWTTPTDVNGLIKKPYIWDLSQMAGAGPGPRSIMKWLSYDRKTCEAWPHPLPQAPNENWQNLVKAVVIRKIYLERNKPATIRPGNIRPLLSLSVCAGEKNPWELDAVDVRKLLSSINNFDHSGKFATHILSVCKTIFDQNRLSLYSPVTPVGIPRMETVNGKSIKVRKSLLDRKSHEKLPEEDAFWEIIRIIWSEQPAAAVDVARFAMVKLLVICGMRISEASIIPLDCLMWINLNPEKILGKLPKQAKRLSLALEHFAAKKRSTRFDSDALYDVKLHIPDMFQDSIVEIIEQFIDYSKPMRDRLRAQCQTGRIFPEYSEDEIVPVLEFYTRLTGEPFIYEDPEEEELIRKWKTTNNLDVLLEIERRQSSLRGIGKLKRGVTHCFTTALSKKNLNGKLERAPFVTETGAPYQQNRLDYHKLYFRVKELEARVRLKMPTKLSDTKPRTLRTGKKIYPHEFLFLSPKRALAETRNGRICDYRKYAFVGMMSPSKLDTSLSGTNKTTPTLFQKYSPTDAKRKLKINTHGFRHLQNTELFRLGVSDAIITKRFNRNSVTQSHVYDHRSLAEDLKAVELPENAKAILSGKAADTFRMIAGGMAKGPIVDEFREIQKTYGDEDAYSFLMAEADGLHTTPYGHCINSFTVDPCPKHLECFSGCVHLTRSPLTEHTENLEKTRTRFKGLLNSIDDHPAPPGAKKKMKEQAEERLAGLDKMLATPVGEKVFPDGKDLSRPITTQFSGPFHD